MFVLDTNTLIYFFKGTGKVSDKLLEKNPSEIGLPSIVLYELETGIAKSPSPAKRRKQLDDFLSAVNLLPFAEKEAKAAADIRVELEKKGNPVGPLDILIAATAMGSGSILITHNTSEFSRVPGLRMEDWY